MKKQFGVILLLSCQNGVTDYFVTINIYYYVHIYVCHFTMRSSLYRSGISQQDIRTVYQYLITSLFPDYHEKEMTPTNTTGNANYNESQFGQYASYSTQYRCFHISHCQKIAKYPSKRILVTFWYCNVTYLLSE